MTDIHSAKNEGQCVPFPPGKFSLHHFVSQRYVLHSLATQGLISLSLYVCVCVCVCVCGKTNQLERPEMRSERYGGYLPTVVGQP